MSDNGPVETWNMATETLKRISTLLDLCSFHFQNKSYIGVYETMLDLRRNLSAFLEDNEFEEVNKLFNRLPMNWRSKTNKNGIIPLHYIAVVTVLDEIYIYFIRKMKKKGILMPQTLDKNKSIIGM